MDLIKIGQKLSINIEKDDKLVEIIGTVSEVLEDRLRIELPPYFMRYIEFLDAGRQLTIKVFSKIGTIDFNTVVISSPLEENFEIEFDTNSLKLTPGEELSVINAVETLKVTANEVTFTTKTFELSTEYFKFYSDIKMNPDDNINCELILSENYGTISYKATIVEVDTVYDNEYKASYYSMSEQDRETLLYYMYVYANSNDQE